MDDDVLLMDPGPVQVAREVREAGARPLVSHRSPEFEATHARCQRGIAAAFGTETDPVLVNGNGWMGVETGMAGVLNPDDEVLAIQTGQFGTENGDIAEHYAGTVRRLDAAWGASVDLDAVRAELERGADAVTMAHCETSTGVVNPVREVASLAREHDALLFVDGVSSVGGEPFAFDEWGVDVAATASQKALGGPPGISALALSEPARERVDAANCPFSLNLADHLDELERNQTPSTAPVQTYYSLAEAVAPLVDDGVEARIERCRRLAAGIRAGTGALGLDPFAEPADHSKLSNTVQAVTLPEGVAERDVLDGLADRGVSVRGGLGRLQGGMLRIATMGSSIDGDDVVRAVGALGETLAALDAAACSPDAAREAARDAL
ncbi:MAG: alanine--glyoxylate aminotransferase family protein [Haloferacaceae archaeon]